MLRLPLPFVGLVASVTCFLSGVPVNAQRTTAAHLQAIRFWSFGSVTRIAIQTEGDYILSSDRVEKPAGLYFDLTGLRLPLSGSAGLQTVRVNDRLLRQIRIVQIGRMKTRLVFDLNAPVNVISSQLVNPDRLMVELRPLSEPVTAVSLARSSGSTRSVDRKATNALNPLITVVENRSLKSPVTLNQPAALRRDVIPASVLPKVFPNAPDREPLTAPAIGTSVPSGVPPSIAAVSAHDMPLAVPPTIKPSGVIAAAKRDNNGDRSLVRVLGLKLGRVVIDAGHGGYDTGTIGPGGLLEKELVLDVALRLGNLVTHELGAEVVYTRSDDTFIPLEQRTRMANNERADLFISIHANSSPEATASGVETFYFNLTADKPGLDLATRENATSVSSISDLNDLLHKAVLENKLEESREFAQKVQTALWTTSLKMNARSRDRGVRTAPFVVLIGATMPSILAEIGFVSNPHDEHLLTRSDERQKVAEALFRGISQYASTLSHAQLASSGSK